MTESWKYNKQIVYRCQVSWRVADGAAGVIVSNVALLCPPTNLSAIFFEFMQFPTARADNILSAMNHLQAVVARRKIQKLKLTFAVGIKQKIASYWIYFVLSYSLLTDCLSCYTNESKTKEWGQPLTLDESLKSIAQAVTL